VPEPQQGKRETSGKDCPKLSDRTAKNLRAINRAADEFVKAVVGMTTKEIGKEITKRTQIQKYHHENPKAKQEDIAKMFGVSQQYVSKVTTESCELKETVVVPDWIKSSRDQADFRKLPAELREMVAAREVSLNQAAIQAGIRKKPTAEFSVSEEFQIVEPRSSGTG
jgi:DNA-binding MarR family transcriptional regulator